jgi:hypothetical protein
MPPRTEKVATFGRRSSAGSLPSSRLLAFLADRKEVPDWTPDSKRNRKVHLLFQMPFELLADDFDIRSFPLQTVGSNPISFRGRQRDTCQYRAAVRYCP